MFLAFGVFFLYFGKDYQFGTALSMGPGYLPMVLGGALVLVGLIACGKGALTAGEVSTGWSLRPLLLLCSAFLAFSFLIEVFGLVVAAVACMLIAGLAGREFRIGEQLVLSISTAVTAAFVFVFLLGLPMRFAPPFLGLGY
jgi:hypothetical protein